MPKTRIPLLSLVLGYLPMLLLAAGSLLTWLVPPSWGIVLAHGVIVWAGAILAFLAGVRRGLSFRQPGGPATAQILTMFWLFVLAVAALLSPLNLVAIVLLLIGYASIALLDPVAARHDEVPGFFARLRPLQMLVPVVSLLALAAFYISDNP